MQLPMKEVSDSKICKRCHIRLKEFNKFKLMVQDSELRLESTEAVNDGAFVETFGGNLVKVVKSGADAEEDLFDLISMSPNASENEEDVEMIEYLEEIVTEKTNDEPEVDSGDSLFDGATVDAEEIIIVTQNISDAEDEAAGQEVGIVVQGDLYTDGIHTWVHDGEDLTEMPDDDNDNSTTGLLEESVSYEGLIVNPEPALIEKIIQERVLEMGTKKPRRRYPYKSKRKPKLCQICNVEVVANLFGVHQLSHKSTAEITADDKERYGEYLCELCNTFATNLAEHKEAVHGTRVIITCKICKIAMKREMMEAHMKKHFDAFRCDLCDKSFSCEEQVQSHMEAMHTDGDRKFFCPHCEEGFLCQQVLEDHVISVHDRRTFVCEDCGKCFSSKSTLNAHKYSSMYSSCLETVHPAQRKFLAVCVCGEKSNSMAMFLRHMDVHKLDDRMHCVLCMKSYAYKKPFMLHMVKDHNTDTIV